MEPSLEIFGLVQEGGLQSLIIVWKQCHIWETQASNDQMYTITVKREGTYNSVFKELRNVFVQLRVP